MLEAKEHVVVWRKRYFARQHPWPVNRIAVNTEIKGAHALGVTSLEVDNNYLFSGSHDSSITMYSIDSLRPVHSFYGHTYSIWALKSDGKRLYSGSNDHTIRVWDLRKKISKSIHTTHDTKIFSLALKDNVLISAGDEVIKVWNKKGMKVIQELRAHTRGVNTTTVHGHHLVSGSSDKTVRVWDLNTMQNVTTIDGASSGGVLSMALIDANTLATGSNTCHITICDIRDNLNRTVIQNAHRWDVWQLNMCGGHLFSGSFDHTIKTWDLRNYSNQMTITGHRGYIHALTSSTFNLFSGSADKSIRVYSPLV
eukprot:gene13860-16344_t